MKSALSLLAEFKKRFDEGKEQVDLVIEATEKSRRLIRHNVESMKAWYYQYRMDSAPVTISAQLKKRLFMKPGFSLSRPEPEEFLGDVILEASINMENNEEFSELSDQMRMWFLRQTLPKLSQYGVNVKVSVGIHKPAPLIYSIPGYEDGIPPNWSIVTVRTDKGDMVWADGPYADAVLSGIAYGSFPGKHPEMGHKLHESMAEVIETRSLLSLLAGPTRIPTPIKVAPLQRLFKPFLGGGSDADHDAE